MTSHETRRRGQQGPHVSACNALDTDRVVGQGPAGPTPQNGSYRFEVVGAPKGQPRPRAFRRGAKAGVFTPGGPHRDWRAAVYTVAERHRPDEPAEQTMAVKLAFRFPRPKSHMGTGRNAGSIKGSAPATHRSKPDLDNMAKLVLDVLTQLGFWRDDSQVAELLVSKRWAQPGEAPGVTVEVTHD